MKIKWNNFTDTLKWVHGWLRALLHLPSTELETKENCYVLFLQF